MQAYAIYKQALDTYKETKAKAPEKYIRYLEALKAQLEKVAKEFNKSMQERSTKAEEEKREQELKKLKEEIKSITYDIKRAVKAIEEEDTHRRVLENRLQRRKDIVKGKGLSLDIAPDEELSDGGYSSIEEFHEKETLPQKHRIKKNRFRDPYPSFFEYPHQIPTHHTVDNLSVGEQQELQKRIEAKAKQEKEKKS